MISHLKKVLIVLAVGTATVLGIKKANAAPTPGPTPPKPQPAPPPKPNPPAPSPTPSAQPGSVAATVTTLNAIPAASLTQPQAQQLVAAIAKLPPGPNGGGMLDGQEVFGSSDLGQTAQGTADVSAPLAGGDTSSGDDSIL